MVEMCNVTEDGNILQVQLNIHYTVTMCIGRM